MGFGPGLARCSVCQRGPILNRGCEKCKVRLCKSCSHICLLPKSNIVVAAAEGESFDLDQLTALTAWVHPIYDQSGFIGLKVSCSTLGGGHVGTFESSGDMQVSELKRCL